MEEINNGRHHMVCDEDTLIYDLTSFYTFVVYIGSTICLGMYPYVATGYKSLDTC